MFTTIIETNEENKMKTQEIVIEGMHCNHCVMAVRKELSKIKNLSVQDVQIGKARIEFDDTKVQASEIAHAIEEAGYKLVSI